MGITSYSQGRATASYGFFKQAFIVLRRRYRTAEKAQPSNIQAAPSSVSSMPPQEFSLFSRRTIANADR
jgi:hypothetical protein